MNSLTKACHDWNLAHRFLRINFVKKRRIELIILKLNFFTQIPTQGCLYNNVKYLTFVV